MKWPSIPQPTQEVGSLQNSLLAAKENIEIIQGVRGASPFLLASSMESYDNQLAQYKKDQAATVKALQDKDTALTAADAAMALRLDDIERGWKVLVKERYSVPISAGVTKKWLNLGGYAALKMQFYIKAPATGWPYFQYTKDNGATWVGAANDYIGTLVYQTEGTSAVNGSTTPNSTAIPLTWTNALSAGSAYGMSGEFNISNWSDPTYIGQAKLQGLMTYHYTTGVLTGQFNYRTSQIAQFNGIQLWAASASAGTVLEGYMIIEGIKIP